MFLCLKNPKKEKSQLSFPMHKEIDTGTLLEIIRQSKSKNEFLELL